MRLLVISDAPILHKYRVKQAYAPYVKEMDIWMRQFAETQFVCPTRYRFNILTEAFIDQDFQVRSLKRLEFDTILNGLVSCIVAPYQFFVLLVWMSKADHIHLRSPGNLCFLACFAQIFFRKPKTAKYAGNWDPHAKQPKLYKIQKWILSNTFLTRNMTVLAYGEWPNQSKNVKSFFTATYLEQDRGETFKNFKTEFRAMFVGTMGQNKRPLETVQVVHALRNNGVHITIDMYGAGSERKMIEKYIDTHALKDHVFLHGNQPAEVVKETYKKSHFLILLSKSEGWPKVVAEAMFYGVVPIVTSISCVPWMLGQGQRGFLLDDWSDDEIVKLSGQLKNVTILEQMSKEAQLWSQQFTLDSFESAIKQLL